MAFRVEVSPGAKHDVATAFGWYKERSLTAANAFRAEVLGVLDRIAEHPESWAVWDESIRRYVMKRYPYTVYFEVDQVVVRILAVAHHRQRPNHWEQR